MNVEDGRITINKELNNLDLFVISFIEHFKSPYVLVSGYVSILFGRSRISEDIDILVPVMTKEHFAEIHRHLLTTFWCINGENPKTLYTLLRNNHAIRYAYKNHVLPNMEVKFIQNPIHQEAFSHPISVIMGKHFLLVSPIELQIIYKEIVLGSKKDKEDALHLREVFRDHLSQEKIKYYENLVKQYA